MAPRFPNIFIDPLDPADFVPSPPGATPGFTQDVIDTLGNQGDSTDGFEELLAGAGQLIDAWDAAAAASDADLDAVLTLLDATKPDNLDTSVAGYVSTIPYGASVVSDATLLAPPQLLEFPLNANMTVGGIAPPASQSAVDFGSIKLGSAPLVRFLGSSHSVKTGRSGVYGIALAVGDPAIWKIHEVQGPLYQVPLPGGAHFTGFDLTDSLVVTPAKLGKFVAQVNIINSPALGFNVVTYTVTVVA